MVITSAIGRERALGIARLMSRLLFEVSPIYPVTLGNVSLPLVVVAMQARWRRAAKVDPIETLRYE